MTARDADETAPVPALKQTILIVDDTPQNLTLLGELLLPLYRVRAANSGARALRATAGQAPDLILLDGWSARWRGA
ncbi:hypothetical protein [uncultured Thiodictyon sp.]|jgi:putative two-component system response regulator|uniref:hypothetical protein n=1 Tax=uncultured Thiodictyon sp. TaxID=1846217 RepID=UPI0034577D76